MATVRVLRLAGLLVAVSSLAGGVFVAACSSSASNPQPTYNVTDAGDASVAPDSGGPDTSPSAEASADSSQDATADATEDATGDGAADVATDAPPFDAAACTTDAGCWSCTPTTTTQFLNQCTSSSCSPFDNFSRLPDYDGGLPPLQ